MRTPHLSHDHELLTIDEAASRYGPTKRTLYHWRSCRKGPKAFRLANGRLRYRNSDVEQWIQEQDTDEKANIS